MASSASAAQHAGRHRPDDETHARCGADHPVDLVIGELVGPVRDRAACESERARERGMRTAEDLGCLVLCHAAQFTALTIGTSTAVTDKMLRLVNMGTLKERLEEACAARRVSTADARAEIQKLTGMTRSNMSHWWNGRTKVPQVKAAVIAANYLKVNPLWLAYEIGQRDAGPPSNDHGSGWKMPEKYARLDAGEIEGLLSIYMEMDPDVRGTWRRQGRDLLELMGQPTPDNPFGKGKRPPRGKKGRGGPKRT